MVIPYPRRGIWRALARLPIWLYRLGLGGLLGSRFLLLEHRGRKSGRVYQTVVEVIKHDKRTGAYYAVSGFGKRSDWFKNIQVHPDVSIQVGRRRLPVHARILPPQEGARVLMEFARRHPREVAILARLLGIPVPQSEEAYRRFGQDYPVVMFQPRTSHSRPQGEKNAS